MLRRAAVFSLLLLVAGGCGKRGLPPSPDRWSPKLTGAKPVDRNHVDLVFSEKMDRASMGNRDNYAAVNADGDTLTIHSANLLPDGQTVRLTTDRQETITYSILVSKAKDVAGNSLKPGSVLSFKGSSKADTTRPQVRSIYPPDGSIGVALDTTLEVVFSETMDTVSCSIRSGALIVLPPPTDSTLTWNEEMSVLSLPLVSLSAYKSSVHVTKGCKDYAGNSLHGHMKSTFTMLDSMPGGIISGVIAAPEGTTPFMSPIGVFDTLWIPLLLEFATDSIGSFTFTHLSDGRYIVAAAVDEDGDGEFDLRGVSSELVIEAAGALKDISVDLTRERILEDKLERTLANFHGMNLSR